MRIRILGPVEVVDELGAPVRLASRQQRLLLAALAAAEGGVVTVDALIELIWGDSLPNDPMAALQSQVSRLRRRLGPGVRIATTPAGYRLATPEIVDAVQFHRLVPPPDGSDEGTLKALDEALALWHGRPMAGLDAPALEPSAIALEDARAEAAERRVAVLLSLARYGEAAAQAGRLAAELPYRERPVALRMEALAAAGRHPEALRVFEEFRRNLADELGLTPSGDLAELQWRILDPGPETRARLPAVPPTSIVGREAETAAASHSVLQHRLVTLTGPGGVGKTRLALHVAHATVEAFPDGTWFCDLSTLTPGSRIDQVLAERVGVKPRAGEALKDQIVAHLHARRGMLVLDNCEHVLDNVVRFVTALLDGAPRTTILATSRERLRVRGEFRLPVEPLALTAARDQLPPAVELFAQRARAANPAFDLAATRAEVDELCATVGGLPLGIEIAASHAATLALPDIIRELHRQEGDLAGERDRDHRHESIRHVVEWSCDLLRPEERDLFERMAIFPGGSAVESAAAVAGGGATPEAVADRLNRLAEQSLLTAVTTGHTTRWRILEPVRAFAEARLHHSDEYQGLRDRHAAFFVTWVAGANTGLGGCDEPAWAARLAAELDNLRSAHRWLIDTGQHERLVRLVGTCYPWAFAGAPPEVTDWASEAVPIADSLGIADATTPHVVGVFAVAALGAWRHGHVEEAIRLATRGVEIGGRGERAARWALEELGDACIIAGRYDEAIDAYVAAIPLAESTGDVVTLTNCSGSVALALAYQGKSEEALRRADSLLDGTASVDNPTALGWAHYFAGEVRVETSPGQAQPLLRRAVAEARRAGNRFLEGVAWASLVSVEARVDASTPGLSRYLHLLSHWQQTGARTQLWITIRSLVEGLARRGHLDSAAVLYGALTTSPTASKPTGADARRLLETVDQISRAVGREMFDTLRAEGAAMSDDDAVSYAHAVLSTLERDA